MANGRTLIHSIHSVGATFGTGLLVVGIVAAHEVVVPALLVFVFGAIYDAGY